MMSATNYNNFHKNAPKKSPRKNREDFKDLKFSLNL